MVGALARLCLASRDFGKQSLLNFQNPFHNNFAQAIEIEIFYKEAEKIVRKLLSMEMDVRPTTIAGESNSATVAGFKGIGAIEAPRGGLYHEIHLDSSTPLGAGGIITYANIITPTVQNLTSIEKSSQALLNQTQKLEKEKREKLLNMLVRAYDPCISCAVH
jgi:sulfhydrogenase subunit alpha